MLRAAYGKGCRAGGSREVRVPEEVPSPLRASEAVIAADSSDKMGSGVEAGIRDVPRVGAVICMLDADGAFVLLEIAAVPCRVRVPYELPDASGALYLIVGACLA